MNNAAYQFDASKAGKGDASIPNVIVVDPHFENYKGLAASARLGKVNVHFRSTGAHALKLARRQPVDAWLVAQELDDMSGHDFLELLQSRQDMSKAAIVQAEDAQGRKAKIASREAAEVGADSLLSPPITLSDLERLLGVGGVAPMPAQAGGRKGRSLMKLSVNVGAVAVAIAVLITG